MENYTLATDEVPLFTGDITWSHQPEEAWQLALTNRNLVFIRQTEEDPMVVTHPVETVKIYEGTPQIRQKGRKTVIFLTTGELQFSFRRLTEAGRFMNAALRLLTGQSKLNRSVRQVKKTVEDVNDALGINLLEETKNFTVDTVSRILDNTLPGGLRRRGGKKKK